MSCGRCAWSNGFGDGRASHGGRGGCWGGGVCGLAGARCKPQSSGQRLALPVLYAPTSVRLPIEGSNNMIAAVVARLTRRVSFCRYPGGD